MAVCTLLVWHPPSPSLAAASCPQHCLGRSWSTLSMKWWKLVYGWKGQPSNAWADSRGRHRLTISRVTMEINPLHEREWDSIQSAFWECGSHGLAGAWGKIFLCGTAGGRMNLTDWDDRVRCAVCGLFLLYSNAVALCTTVLVYCTGSYSNCAIVQYAAYTVCIYSTYSMRNSTVRVISAFFLHFRVQ